MDLDRISAFPPVAARLLTLLADDDLEIQAIADTIRGDPALAASLLERANSPLFGFAHRIETVTRAINMLGLSTVHKLTLSAVAHAFAQHHLKRQEFQRVWRHTLATAFLTSELAWACSLGEELAYTAGLLHDIGRIGLIAAYPAEYAEILRRAEEETYDILDLERDRFGADHCELGRLLTEKWSLPDAIRVASGRHHDRPDRGELSLLHLVQFGCRMAGSLGFEAVRPRQPLTLAEIREMLPAEAQARFTASAEQLTASIENEMRVYSGMPVPDLGSAPHRGVEEDPLLTPAASGAPRPSAVSVPRFLLWGASVIALILLFEAFLLIR